MLSQRGNTIFFVLIGILGLGTVIFGILAIIAFGQAQTAKTTLNAEKLAAANTAREEQKQADEEANRKLNESPYRSYTAPQEYGSFEIKFPKTWSATVDEGRSGLNQVTLSAAPDFIRTSNATAALLPLKVTLVQRTADEYLKQYVSDKRLTIKDTTVTGLAAKEISGTFNDKRTVRMVVVPVRDKVIVFTNEDAKYEPQFAQAIAESIIRP